MKKIVSAIIAAAALLGACCEKRASYTSFVDPFIGTAATGHTYPGAIVPFGMVSASPDTGISGWANCSGYHSDDGSIMGFSQTHMSGTGAEDMGDIMLMPVTGEPVFYPGSKENPDDGYRSRYSKENERARPGYYSVVLDDYGITAEITATSRCAFYRFAYPAGKDAGIIFDMEHGVGDKTTEYDITVVDDRTIQGYRRSTGFIKDHVYYFYAVFSEPFTATETFVDKMYARFAPGKRVSMKIGISTVSEQGAAKNLEAEIPGWRFDKIAAAADRAWNEHLAAIEIDALDDDRKTIFYTAMYHSSIVPNLISDVDGRYRGWDKQVHAGRTGDLYTNYSLWDTYRAVHPLFNMLFPDMNRQFINSMIERHRQTGALPINEYGTCETYCMIGYHAVSVIADAILGDAGGFDYEEAYAAMKDIAMDDARGVGLMKKYGYIPSELEDNSVSKVLEYAYNDWCVAQVAKKLGKQEDYRYFTGRARNYRNQFDPSTLFMRGRHADGSWVTPFDPKAVSGLGQHDFTEGNSWQYSFYVPQDMTTFISMLGGDKLFTERLDAMFVTESAEGDIEIPDVTGLIGQYAHGNEPSHHIAYLYNFAGQPWKTQQTVGRIKDELYLTGREGLCGNDDCGQISCWYIFSTLGFYPVTPAMDYYVIGSPSVKSARVNLPGGKCFEIKAPDASPENRYIQSVKLNGSDYDKSYIEIAEVLRGGTMEFTMGPGPNFARGVDPASRPVSVIKD